MAALAKRTRTPIEVVKHLYDQEIAELQSKSVVKNFIAPGDHISTRLMAAHSASATTEAPIEPG